MSVISEEQVFHRITPIFREVLDNTGLIVTRELNALAVRGWDSLAHVTLVSAVEEEFDVHFALGELQDLKNVGDMVDLILKKHLAS